MVLARQLGNVSQLGAGLYIQAMALTNQKQHAQALAVALDAMPPLRQSRSRLLEAECVNVIGHAHAGLGDPAAARRCFSEARAICGEITPGGPMGLSRLALMAAQDLDLGDIQAANAGVEAVLASLEDGSSTEAVSGFIAVHWACQRVLAAAADPRAPAHLEELQARVRAHALQAAGNESAAATLIRRSDLFSRIPALPAPATRGP